MSWDLPHQEYLYSHLQRVTDGTTKRLMVFMPPRHGKSETVTVRYTAWRMSRDPSTNVILGSYNQRLADRFSRKVRRVLADDAAVSLKERRDDGDASVPPTVAGGAFEAQNKEARRGPTDTARRRDLPTGTACVPPERAARSFLPFAQKPANTVSEWETTEGGTFRAVGVGAGVTGFGAKLIVVDDPVKSRAEAESETYRDKVYEWFTDDLYTRLEPDGAIILIQTRWHEDDLAGRLIKEMNDGGEQWEIVDLPALCEGSETAAGGLRERGTAQGSPPYEGGVAPSSPAGWFSAPQSEGRPKAGPTTLEPAPSSPSPRPGVPAVQPAFDPIGRLPGEALWPERYDEQKLLEIKRKLGSYSFAALYQQRPVPAEGGLFKRKWFKQMVETPPTGLQWKRGYDLAVSTRTNACYTASARCAFDKEGNLYIADVFRRRIEFPEQRRYIIHNLLTEKDTEHGIELALHGQAMMQDLRREAAARGKAFKGVKVDADKVTRSLSWANLAEEGKVVLVRGPWIQDFLDEVCRFPSGQTDDQVDAVSIAVRMCRHHKTRMFWSF
jgi:predicted phage terminase large subunit-like protein